MQDRQVDNPMTLGGYRDGEVAPERCPICGVCGLDTVYKNVFTGEVVGCDNCVKPYDPEVLFCCEYEE